MQYPWAYKGNKVVYIGPDVNHALAYTVAGPTHVVIPTPFKRNVVYTIVEVTVLPTIATIGEEVCIIVDRDSNLPASAKMWKPLSKADSEMFNELLTDLPKDLIVERLSEETEESLDVLDALLVQLNRFNNG